MTKIDAKKIFIARYMCSDMPPIIRDRVLSDSDIQRELNIKANAKVLIGNMGVEFDRSLFYRSLKMAINSKDEITIEDSNARRWTFACEKLENEILRLSIINAESKLVLPDFSLMSEDSNVRILDIEENLRKYFLLPASREYWHDLASRSPLGDNEVDEFHAQIHDTPEFLARSIRRQLHAGESTVESLIPSSPRYYQNLIGEYNGSATLDDYISTSIKNHSRELLGWSHYDGLLRCFLLFSHPSLSTTIDLDEVDADILIRAFDYACRNGDPLSRQASMEIGIRQVAFRPEVESSVLDVIRSVVGENLERYQAELNLFASIFILVDGQLSRNKALSKEPPFYRRMASLAHAGVIFRELTQFELENDFSEWALGMRAREFVMQTFADMRQEPRWQPDDATAINFQNHFFLRLANAVQSANLSVDSSIYKAISGDDPESVISSIDCQYFQYHSPLEGEETSTTNLPDGYAKSVENQLHEKQDNPSPASFIALVNLSRLYAVNPRHVELASSLLSKNNHRFSNIKDRDQLLATLNGLATVAAVSRSLSLTDELRILTRRYRFDVQYHLTIPEAFNINLLASASRSDLGEWCKLVGDWLTEFAFGDLNDDDAQFLFNNLRYLMHSVPELWLHCSQADAALRAYILRR